MKTFAIYDNKDMIRFVGYPHECARFLGITRASFYSKVCKAKKKEEVKYNLRYKIYEVKDD